MVNVGQNVENFVLSSTGERDFNLSEHLGKNVIIYFYPKDDTPGCTTEGQDFRDNWDAFNRKNSVIVGISRDNIKSHENFKSKMQFPFELLSDSDETVCNLFGVMKMKNMYGKQVRGIERSTFIIDGQGILIKEWRAVKVPGHVLEILDYLTEQNQN